MANEQNLRPCEHKLTKEEQKKGGRKSGEVRRNRKMLRDCLDYLLSQEDKTILDENGNAMTGAERLAISLFQKALCEEDTSKAAKAFEVIRDSSGQKVPDKVETKQTVIDMSKFTTEELKGMLDDDIS